jgi:guanosine-3',5'-bis(diphosphate) 3'-pyrophosphohydrolase
MKESTRYPKVQEAIRWAAKLHGGQERDGDDPLPYITHPIEVLVNLRYVGGITDEDLLVVALLHDTIEECDADPAEIEKRFGKRVASLVQELTRQEPTAKETEGLSREEIWQLRANMLLEEIGRMSPDAQKVKLADRLSNLREAIRTKWASKLVRYLGHTAQILETIPRQVNPPLWDAIRNLLETMATEEQALTAEGF